MVLSKINSSLIFTALTVSLLLPTKVYACACCANPGTWSQTTQKLSDYDNQQINRLQFASNAKIYQTPRGENVGVASNSTDYNLTLTKNQRRWNLQFKDAQGKTGTLTLNIPTNAVYFKTDLGENRQGGETRLYKEIRLEGTVSGNGIFAKGITSNTKFRLVLQGRGNNCNAAEDFKSWNLQVFGSRADYAFYGNFR